jgi:hypothetical protein
MACNAPIRPCRNSGSRGFNVEVINADHQNRPDVGVNIAGNGTTRAWT